MPTNATPSHDTAQIPAARSDPHKTAILPAKTLPPRTFTLWSAVAHNAPLKTRFGHTHDRELYLFGIQQSIPLVSGKYGTLEYTNDLLPLVITTETPFYRDTTVVHTCGPGLPIHCGSDFHIVTFDSLIQYKKTVYGAGLIPIGFRYVVGPRAVQFLVGMSAGAIYFQHRIPDPGETRVNFTLDGTALFRIHVWQRNAFTIGYHFNHISNANTGRENPGMNSVMLDVGWTYTRGGARQEGPLK
jgi:hypothetical protein